MLLGRLKAFGVCNSRGVVCGVPGIEVLEQDAWTPASIEVVDMCVVAIDYKVGYQLGNFCPTNVFSIRILRGAFCDTALYFYLK